MSNLQTKIKIFWQYKYIFLSFAQISAYSDEKGSAWTWHDGRQQWYYHKFHNLQPDLNLRNEKVIKELMVIHRY